KGKVIKPYNENGVSKATIRLLDSKGEMLAETYSDEEGNYRLEVPWEDVVVLEAVKERYSKYRKQFSGEELNGLENKTYDVGMSLYDDLVGEKEGQAVV